MPMCLHHLLQQTQSTSNLLNLVTLVFAAGRPNSNFLFLRSGFLLPPVARRLCQWSRDMPLKKQFNAQYYYTKYILKLYLYFHGVRIFYSTTITSINNFQCNILVQMSFSILGRLQCHVESQVQNAVGSIMSTKHSEYYQSSSLTKTLLFL